MVHALAEVAGWVSRVGIPGWVYRGAIPGYYPATPKSTLRPAKRAPEGLQGLEWVGLRVRALGTCGDGGGDGPGTTPAGPGRSSPAGPPCTGTLQIAASWPYRARY